MKLIKATLGILSAALVLTACGGKDKKAEDKTETKTEVSATPSADATKLEGSWEIKREDGEAASDQVGTVYEFKGNKLTTGKDGVNIPGTTEVTDNTFSFLADGGKDKIMYNYHFDGDTLVIAMQDGPQVFHLVKK